MKCKGSITRFIVSLCFLLSFAAITANAHEHNLPTKTLNDLFTAIETNNYDQFISQAGAAFKATFTQQMLSGLNELLSPKITKGYDKLYLGELRQKGYDVYLWKLAFKDNSDDILVRLVINDNKVVGFFLQ